MFTHRGYTLYRGVTMEIPSCYLGLISNDIVSTKFIIIVTILILKLSISNI